MSILAQVCHLYWSLLYYKISYALILRLLRGAQYYIQTKYGLQTTSSAAVSFPSFLEIHQGLSTNYQDKVC